LQSPEDRVVLVVRDLRPRLDVIKEGMVPELLSEALGFRARFVEAHRARIGMGGSWLIGPE